MKLLAAGLVIFMAAWAQPPQRGGGRQGASGAQQVAQAQVKTEDLCTVEGSVSSAASGELLKKATVRLRRTDFSAQTSSSPRSYMATTDSSGRFTISGVAPGKYRLSAERNGYVDMEYGARDLQSAGSTITLEVKQRVGELNFRMTPHGVISGRVVDEDGEPMAGVRMAAQRYRYSNGRKQMVPVDDATTNDLGEYRIYGLAPGRYYISAQASRGQGGGRGGPEMGMWIQQQPTQVEQQYVSTYYPGTTDVGTAAPLELAAGAQMGSVDFRLHKQNTFRVRGRVTDTTASAGAQNRRISVMLMPRDGGAPGFSLRAAVVDAEGNFEIRNVAQGAYHLVASVFERDGGISAHVPVQVSRGDVDGVMVVLQPPVEVRGQFVVDGQSSTPPSLANVQVSLRPRDPGANMLRPQAVTSNQSGVFTAPKVNPDAYVLSFSNLPDGYYVKSIQANGQDAVSSVVDLGKGAAGLITVVLRPNAGVASGVVQNDQQQPAPDATVVLVPQEKERKELAQYYRVATTDTSGRFTIKNLDPGQYKAYAWQKVEAGVYMDPDFLQPFEVRGAAVSIKESSQEELTLKLIP